MSWARLAAATEDETLLAARLGRAAVQLDAMLGEILRLHHRRGLRERYLTPIESLLRTLPVEGPASDVLLPLAATRGNALGDWLAICAWAEEVASHTAVPSKLKYELTQVLRALRDFGVPHLYGFREKYDDPWSPSVGGGLWDRLSNVAAQLAAHGIASPVAQATNAHCAELCRQRLNEGHCLMATTYAGETAMLWVLSGDRYRRVEFEHEPSGHWYVAQHRFASKLIDRVTFAAELDKLLSVYGAAFDAVLADVAKANCRSIRYLPDFGAPPPLTAFALRNRELAQRMSDGDFEIRIVPALMAPRPCEEPKIESVAAMFDPDDNLLLPRYEGEALANAAGASLKLVTTQTGGDLHELFGDADALLVSTHGTSLEFFTDAYFARLGSMDGSHPIGVESLQHAAPDLKLRLVLLNSCYSASGSSRNFQKEFRTSDRVTIPGLFLVNRRSVVGGGGWPMSDTAAYLYATLVGRALAVGHQPAAALSVATVGLQRLSKGEALTILEAIPNTEVRSAATSRLVNAPEEGAFSHGYIVGGICLYGLM
jgi:hypothetical protein